MGRGGPMSQQAHSGLCNWADVDVVWCHEAQPNRGPQKMSAHRVPNAAARRDLARARLRTLTNGALLAATGATVGIAVVVAHEHPGKSAASATTASQSTSGQTTAGSTGTTGSSDDAGESGSSSTGATGNSGSSSFSPSVSTRTPSV